MSVLYPQTPDAISLGKTCSISTGKGSTETNKILVGKAILTPQSDYTKTLIQLACQILFVLAITLAGEHRGFAQEKKKEPVVSSPKITAADGQQLQLLYYKWEKLPETPVVVLLHMQRSNHLVWKNGYGDQLAKAGYAVIAMDFRKHSGSTAPGTTGNKDSSELSKDDYMKMATLDLEAVKQFIYDEHQAKNLNMTKLAVVAPEMSAPIAINWAVSDWQKMPFDDAPSLELATPRGRDVRALILISPLDSLPGVLTTQALRQISDPNKNVAMLFLVGNKDTEGQKITSKMHAIVAKQPVNAERIQMKAYPYKFKGTDLFVQKKQPGLTIEKDIVDFLDKHVKSITIPWQDRRSRVERE